MTQGRKDDNGQPVSSSEKVLGLWNKCWNGSKTGSLTRR